MAEILDITVPNNHIPERDYILNVLLKEFLGISYQVSCTDITNQYQIRLKHGLLKIEDHFFSKVEEGQYVQAKFIPDTIRLLKHPSFATEELPVLYGHPEILVEDNSITCRADLLGSAFFMLTRWEEYVKPERDKYQRFPLEAALAYQQNFHQRAIVNEYSALLFLLFRQLDPTIEKRKKTFSIIPTHDIDDFERWGSLISTRKSLAHNFITQKNLRLGMRNLKSAINTKLRFTKDPYDTFDYLSEKSGKIGLAAQFYFMAGGRTKYDNRYCISYHKVVDQIKRLYQTGHAIGLHPSFDSHDNAELLGEEKQRLESLIGIDITTGRQHYLRFSVPHTWQLWEDMHMESDSTLGYSETPGFRCGTCYDFPVFNVLTRKTLKLREMPLVLMERSLTDYMALTPEQAVTEAEKIFKEVKKHKGNFVFLWHNSTLFSEEFKRYRFIFEQILNGFHA